jgi:hypothetical protein
VKDDRIWCGYFIIVYSRQSRLSSERYKIVDFLKNAVCYLNNRRYKIDEYLKKFLYYLNSGRYKKKLIEYLWEKKVNRIFLGIVADKIFLQIRKARTKKLIG